MNFKKIEISHQLGFLLNSGVFMMSKILILTLARPKDMSAGISSQTAVVNYTSV